MEIMCFVLQNVNFATTTTNTERFVCNRQKIALNSVANLYVNSPPTQQTKHSLRREVAATDVWKISLQIILFRLTNLLNSMYHQTSKMMKTRIINKG